MQHLPIISCSHWGFSHRQQLPQPPPTSCLPQTGGTTEPGEEPQAGGPSFGVFALRPGLGWKELGKREGVCVLVGAGMPRSTGVKREGEGEGPWDVLS